MLLLERFFFVCLFEFINQIVMLLQGGEMVLAVAHDNPIPGFRTTNTINLRRVPVCLLKHSALNDYHNLLIKLCWPCRLWSSEPTAEFDLGSFNEVMRPAFFFF